MAGANSTRRRRSRRPRPPDLLERLRGYAQTLELARSVVTVAVAALRLQNADRDRDIAAVLMVHVDNRLDELLDDLARAAGVARR